MKPFSFFRIHFSFVVAVSIALFLVSCKTHKNAGKTKTEKNNSASTKTNSDRLDSKNNKKDKAEIVLETAFTYMGTPYKYGAATKDGTDCSGLVMNSFKAIEVSLPRSSKDQSNYTKSIDVKEVVKGDLLFFCTKSNGCKEINHVGIVSKIESGTVYFIHATVQKGVMVNNLNENYYKNSFIKAGRIL